LFISELHFFNSSKVYLLIHHLTIQNLEGIQMDALVKGEDGIADGRVVRQTEVFL
jgi:hypothetical protein